LNILIFTSVLAAFFGDDGVLWVMRNELFTATRGQGAQLNGYRLRGSNARDLDGTIIAREVWQTFNEVGGAIQWIDNPLNILIFTSVLAAFFPPAARARS
jgi:fructose-1,6-bisphosphatase/inositol monophosphatase family enzyme